MGYMEAQREEQQKNIAECAHRQEEAWITEIPVLILRRDMSPLSG